MTRFKFWQTWLLVTCLIMILFGLLIVFLNPTPLFRSLSQPIHGVFWPGEMSPAVLRFQQWVYGAWGATIAGMGTLAAFITHKSFSRREKWARDCLAVGLAVWYIFDTAVSLLSGVTANAGFNTAILIPFALPLAFTWKDFPSGDDLTQSPSEE